MDPDHVERNARTIIRNELPMFRVYVVASGLIYLAIQAIELIPIMLMQIIIDQFIPDKNVERLLFYILLFCGLPMITTVLAGAYRQHLAIIAQKMGIKLALKGFENLMYQPVSYFDKENSVELATYCRAESMKYVMFWLMDIPHLIHGSRSRNRKGGLYLHGYNTVS